MYGERFWDARSCAHTKMLLEVRKLMFSDNFLQRVLLDHCARESVHVPNSQIQKIRINASPGRPTNVVIEFATADPSKPYEVHLNEQIGRASCRERV